MIDTSDRIVIENANKFFETNQGRVTALQDINLTIKDGDFFCIVGPSGCGKTTLLRILADLENTSTGQITIKSSTSGRPINSMVFQEQSIFPWMTMHDKQS